MERRDFLGAVGATGLAALAGCSTALGSVAPPNVPEQALQDGGWVKQNQTQETVLKRSYGPATLEGKAHTLVYEDEALAKDINQKTLGQFEGTFALFAATRIDFSPNLDSLPVSSGMVIDQVESNARDQFRSRMKEAGLTNVKRTSTGEIEVDTGETGRLTEFEAEFPFSGVEFEVTQNETEIEIEGQPLAVEGMLAVWRHADSVLVAGGAFPAENFATTIERNLSEAIHVTVDVDLGLTPKSYREEVRNLVTAVK